MWLIWGSGTEPCHLSGCEPITFLPSACSLGSNLQSVSFAMCEKYSRPSLILACLCFYIPALRSHTHCQQEVRNTHLYSHTHRQWEVGRSSSANVPPGGMAALHGS